MTDSLFPAVILAGGLATRLRPLTHRIPKSLIPICDEPFIAHQLRLLKNQGIQKVILCLGYLGEQIVEFVKDGDAFGLEISYSFDGENLLGTAGSIKKAFSFLPEHFFVLYGDSYLPCSYSSIQQNYIKEKKKALMTVFHNQGFWDKSNVEFTNGCIITYDKKNITRRMNYIDYGLGIFHREVFISLSEQEPSDLEDIYQFLLKQNQLAAYEVKQRFYEIGSHTGISELEAYFKQQ